MSLVRIWLFLILSFFVMIAPLKMTFYETNNRLYILETLNILRDLKKQEKNSYSIVLVSAYTVYLGINKIKYH